MEINRKDDEKTREKKPGISSTPRKSAMTSSQSESSWIMQALNHINDRFDRMLNEFADFKAQIGRVEGKLELLPRIESSLHHIQNRLQRLERYFWIATGVLIAGVVVWTFIQFFLSNFDVVVTPKS